ncbi:MAG: hypothetical protein HRF50_01295 [Phycisphaerae bacterium]
MPRTLSCPYVSIALATLLLAGCEREYEDEADAPKAAATATPAASPRPTAANAASAPAGDAAAAAEFLRGNQPARPQRPAMPPGHPPIDGDARPAAPAQSALPPGHPPMDGGAAAAEAPASTLKYEAPANWTASPASNVMRLAQWTLPKAEGAEEGDMVLFFFGVGGGGGVQMNIDRWRGMFKTADGQPVPDEAVRYETFDANGLKVHYLEVAGSFENRMAPGAPVLGMKESHRMLAAIVEGEGGPWYFRGTGPDATMAAHRDAFLAMLRSLKSEGK